MTAYIKTLRAGGRSPYQSRPWPLPTQRPDGTWEPGEWVTSRHIVRRKTTLTPAQVDACRPAVYACRQDQLPKWIAARAYYIELDSPVEGADKVGARAGRLLRPVEGWTDDALHRFAHACADRAARIHAVSALRAAGLAAEADLLAACPPIVDVASARAAAGDARAAGGAAGAAWDAAWDAAGGDARGAGVAANAAYAAAFAARAADAAAGAAWDAADGAARAAAYARAAAGAARHTAAAEREWQAKRLAELVGLEIER